jgi:hypothetical protein
VHARRKRKKQWKRNEVNITTESRSQEVLEGKLEIWEYVMGKGWFDVSHIVRC